MKGIEIAENITKNRKRKVQKQRKRARGNIKNERLYDSTVTYVL